MLWLPDLEFYNAQDYDEGYFPDSFLRKENHLAIVYNYGKMVHYISQTNLKVIRDIPTFYCVIISENLVCFVFFIVCKLVGKGIAWFKIHYPKFFNCVNLKILISAQG